jgi:hypothetical protein
VQIPTNFSAAQAASIASVVSSREKNLIQTATVAGAPAAQTQLEKSESASPDRDAQGQGDGLGHHARKRKDENEVTAPDDSASTRSKTASQPVDSPDELPPQLDLVC